MRIFPFHEISQAKKKWYIFHIMMNIMIMLEKHSQKNISNETEYGSLEDTLSIYRTATNETALVSEIPYMINDENVII